MLEGEKDSEVVFTSTCIPHASPIMKLNNKQIIDVNIHMEAEHGVDTGLCFRIEETEQGLPLA